MRTHLTRVFKLLRSLLVLAMPTTDFLSDRIPSRTQAGIGDTYTIPILWQWHSTALRDVNDFPTVSEGAKRR